MNKLLLVAMIFISGCSMKEYSPEDTIKAKNYCDKYLMDTVFQYNTFYCTSTLGSYKIPDKIFN